MDFDFKNIEFASSLILKKRPYGVHPHSGRQFAGFPAGFFFVVECHFCIKTRILMICDDIKMLSKSIIIARNDPVRFWWVP